MRIQLYQTKHFYLLLHCRDCLLNNSTQYWWCAAEAENWPLLHSPKWTASLVGHLPEKAPWLTDYKNCWDPELMASFSWACLHSHSLISPAHIFPKYSMARTPDAVPRHNKVIPILSMLCGLLSFVIPFFLSLHLGYFSIDF